MCTLSGSASVCSTKIRKWLSKIVIVIRRITFKYCIAYYIIVAKMANSIALCKIIYWSLSLPEHSLFSILSTLFWSKCCSTSFYLHISTNRKLKNHFKKSKDILFVCLLKSPSTLVWKLCLLLRAYVLNGWHIKTKTRKLRHPVRLVSIY